MKDTYLLIYLIVVGIYGNHRFVVNARSIKENERKGIFGRGLTGPAPSLYYFLVWVFTMLLAPVMAPISILGFVLRGFKTRKKQIVLAESEKQPPVFYGGFLVKSMPPFGASVPFGCCIYCSKGPTAKNPFLSRMNHMEGNKQILAESESYQHWDLGTHKGCEANIQNVSPWGEVVKPAADENISV